MSRTGMANLEIMLMIDLELGRDYRQPNPFENIPCLHLQSMEKSLCPKFHTLFFHSIGKYCAWKASEPFCHGFNGMKEGSRAFVPPTV